MPIKLNVTKLTEFCTNYVDKFLNAKNYLFVKERLIAKGIDVDDIMADEKSKNSLA